MVTTVVQRASDKSKSLRSTIPGEIVKKIGMKKGDTIDWTVKELDHKKAILIRKMQPA